jgi:hypothetical protein
VVLAVLVGLHLWGRRIDAERRAWFEAEQAAMIRRNLLARTQRPRLVEDEPEAGCEGGHPWTSPDQAA